MMVGYLSELKCDIPFAKIADSALLMPAINQHSQSDHEH